MLPGSPGGTPQGLFGPAVTAPASTATASGAGGSRGGGLFQQARGSASGRGGKPSDRSDSEKKQDGEKDKGPQNLARRETGNVWGYVKPNEDPYN
jgi:hypothetical protein